jgi:glycosyltransferase involved in cell wall biosynthesis
MRIIHVVLGKANPERMNGVNKVAHFLASAQHDLGYAVEIWGITKSPDDAVYPRPFPTRLFAAQPIYRDLHPGLLQAIYHEPADTVFHIHGAFIPAFYKISRLLTERKLRYVYTPHGAFNKIALEKSKWLKKFYFEQRERSILRDAHRVHFSGQSEFDNMSNLIRLSNKVIIPNGQDYSELHFEANEINNRRHPVLGFCGRLDIYYKGLDILAEGFSLYLQQGGEGELWLIGDGPDRSKLEKQCRQLRISDRVIFMGARYGKDKLNRIANMDLFCHPSRSEGSPTAVLEAAALGKPLLVSTATNAGQEVERYRCGIHLRQNNPKSIAKAMMQFLNEYRKGIHLESGGRAREMVAREFNWQNIAQRHIHNYRK